MEETTMTSEARKADYERHFAYIMRRDGKGVLLRVTWAFLLRLITAKGEPTAESNGASVPKETEADGDEPVAR